MVADQRSLRQIGWGLAAIIAIAGNGSGVGLAFHISPKDDRGDMQRVYRVGGETAGVPANRRRLAVIAHLAWLAMLIGGAIGMTISRRTDSDHSADTVTG